MFYLNSRHWDKLFQIALAEGRFQDFYNANTRYSDALPAAIRTSPDLPDWLIDAALAKPEGYVANALLSRIADLPTEVTEKLLSVRNQKVARVFAAADLFSTLGDSYRQRFIYSSSLAVRNAIVANPSASTDDKIATLQGRTADGEFISDLLGLPLESVSQFLATLTADQHNALATSAFPELLSLLLVSKNSHADPTLVAATIVDGFEVCASRLARGPQKAAKLTLAYLSAARGLNRCSRAPVAASAAFISKAEEPLRSHRVVFGNRIPANYHEALDLDGLRALVPTLTTFTSVLDALAAPDPVRELSTLLDSPRQISWPDFSHIVSTLASTHEDVQPIRNVLIRLLHHAHAAGYLTDAFGLISSHYPELRLSPLASALATAVPLTDCLAHLEFTDLLEWPAEEVAELLRSRGTSASECLKLSVEFAASTRHHHSAAEILAVLSS